MARKKSPATTIDLAAFDQAGANILSTSLQDEVGQSFMEYAYSVIYSRALPDARDGLKPVHRRIIYSMHENNLAPNKGFVKSARIVGDVMGKYHPHGDSAIYDAMVRMAQGFANNATMVDGHGNFGSPDDSAAASRYCVTGDTRIRLADGTTPRITDVVNLPADSEADADFEVLDKDGKAVRVDKVFNSGRHPILRATTRAGYTIRGSENHLILTLSAPAGVPMFQWKRLDELKPGDYAAIARNSWRQVVPSAREYMLGVLLGGWVTEGWCNETRGGFNNTDQTFFDEVATSYKALVGGPHYVYSRHTRRDRKRIWELDIHNLSHLRDSALAHVVGVRSADKAVPAAIWNGTAGVKRAFLMAAFEGDGGVRGGTDSWRNITVQYASYSEALVDGIQQLLLEFGITCSKRQYERKSGKTEYRLIISGRPNLVAFSERVGFLPTKQATLDEGLRATSQRTGLGQDVVPFVRDYVLAEAPRGGRNWLRSNSVAYPHRWREHRSLILSKIRSDEIIRVLNPIMESGYRFDPIVGIEAQDAEEVYSVRVQSEDHSFLAGAFVNHNTEARMTPFAVAMVDGIDEDTVDFKANYSGDETEPEVLPAAIPSLLVNGASGIAVGMACNLIPHNLGEVVQAARWLVTHPNATLDKLMTFVPGPDLPTGGLLLGMDGVREAYETGRGRVRMRATVEVGPLPGSRGRNAITVTEMPYGVGPEKVIEKIKAEVAKKRLQGVADVKDLTDMNSGGTRLVIECKTGVNPQALLAELYRLTPLEETFGINNLALVDGQPKLLGLKELLEVFLDHRYAVVLRRSVFRRQKRRDRLHLVEGLLKALLDIDKVIRLIRGSENAAAAKDGLMGSFKLTEVQATYILDTPLRRLTKYDALELGAEKERLEAEIAALSDIIDHDASLKKVVADELAQVGKEFATERRTTLVDGDLAEVIEASAPAGPLEVADEPCQVLLSTSGLLARTPVASEETPEMRARRGRVKHDQIAAQAPTTARGQVLVVTNTGRAFKTDVLGLPVLPRRAGTVSLTGMMPAKEVVPLVPGERVVTVCPMGDPAAGSPGLAIGTRHGVVKVAKPDWPVRSEEFTVIGLDAEDEIVGATWLADGTETLCFVTSDAALLKFDAGKVRPQGLSGGGMAGIKVGDGAQVLFFGAVTDGEAMVVTSTGGAVKVTPLAQYPAKGRATGGVRCMRFLKTRGAGEDRLAVAWVGPAPAAGTTAGEPVALPDPDQRRDGAGEAMFGPDLVGTLIEHP